MRWERVVVNGGVGPGKIWGHTCNAVQGGRLLYVFGGFGADNRQTNKVHVFDTVHRIWSEPLMHGALPSPRDSHSCTTIGDKLFVFGGTNEREYLNDLHILDTSSNTWILPNVRGDRPNPREGHSAALSGKQLFIFGGYGRFDDADIYYDDIYVLNTETFVWRHIVPSGPPPNRHAAAQSYSSWNGKIIVIGGQDTSGFIHSDVHILDTDTLVWCKLNTSGQILPTRTEHTTISLGKKQLVFGGIANNGSLFDDVYVFDAAAGTWSKVMPTGDGPSARFSAAGDCLYPHRRGVLVIVGGCDDNFQPLEDMYYLHTGLDRKNEQDERRIETLSLMKKLTLNCQEQQALASSPSYNNLVGFGNNAKRKMLNVVSLIEISHKVSIVSEEPVLVNYSIEENVAYGWGGKASNDDIEKAAKMANTQQYQIYVGDGGLRLSGGQKHTIAIARALLMNPMILLLDEARSALDAESKYLFQDAMNFLMEGRIVLVKNANVVAVVSDGQIVESDTHDDDLLNVQEWDLYNTCEEACS